MKKIQQPKKQPELIRKRILEQAILLAAEKGTSGVSIQSVATGAGITKGGVFHHFANKEILLEEMIKEILFYLDRKVEDIIAQDTREYGKFTRAYIKTSLMQKIDGLVSPWTALSMTTLTDNTFNSLFGQWLQQKIDLYKDTDDHYDLLLLRLASDGIWLQYMTQIIDYEQAMRLTDDLIERSYTTALEPNAPH